jgi:hypothetical protein
MKLCCVDDFWVGNDSVFINDFWVSSSPCGLAISAKYAVPVNQFLFLNSVSPTIIFRCQIVVSASNQFHYRILYCQGICFSLPSCGFHCQTLCRQRINFRCRIVMPAANQFSLLNYVLLANQFLLLNCGVSSELAFIVELWCQQWTSFCCRTLCC